MISPLLDYANRVLAHSPTGLWMLDETSGTTAADISGHSRDGTYQDDYTLGATGPGGSVPDATSIAGELGGLGRIEFPNSATAPLTGDFTLGFLVKLATASTSGWNLIALTTNDTSNNGWSQPMQLSCGGPVHDALHLRWGNGVGAETFVLEPSTSVAVAQWQHITIIARGTTAELYLDGVSIGSATSSQTRSNSGLPMRLGRRSALSNQHGRTGEYAGLFIVSGALTEAEVQYILEPIRRPGGWSVGFLKF